MRILLITLCFNLIFVPLVGQQNQPKARETDRKAAEKQGNPPQPSVPLEVHVSGPVKVEATQPKQQAAKEEPKPFLTHGEWVMGILTLIYVGITFFGLRAINRQAGIAQEAASRQQERTGPHEFRKGLGCSERASSRARDEFE
jgi:hypothetical protein